MLYMDKYLHLDSPKADTRIYVYKWFMRRKISGSISGGWESWEGSSAVDNPVIVLGRWGSILLEAAKGHLECTSELSHQCGETSINGFKDSCPSSTESCPSGQKIQLPWVPLHMDESSRRKAETYKHVDRCDQHTRDSHHSSQWCLWETKRI